MKWFSPNLYPLTTFRTLLVSLALLGFTIPGARGDYFYNWGPDHPEAYSDNSGMLVQLSDAAESSPVSGKQSMVATVLTTFISPGINGTDFFSQGQKVSLGLDLVDGTEHGNVSFGIGISGSLSAIGSNLIYTYLDGKTKTLTVNGNQYTVTLGGSGSIPGEILATIDPYGSSEPPSGGGSEPPSTAPEPSAIVLVLIGLSILGFSRRRRLCLSGR